MAARSPHLPPSAVLLDALPCAAAIIGEDGTLLTVNRAWRDARQGASHPLFALGPGQSCLGLGEGGQAGEEYRRLCLAIIEVLRGRAERVRVNVGDERSGEGGLLEAIITGLSRCEPGGAQALLLLHDASDHARLRDSEERFRLAISGSTDGIWDMNLLKRQLYCSARALELLGLPERAGPLRLSTLRAHLFAEDRRMVAWAIHDHLRQRTPCDVEFRFRTRQGDLEHRWFRLRGQAIWSEAGRPIRMAGTITDVTERRQADEALMQYTFEIEESKSRLAAQAEQLGKQAQDLARARDEALSATRAKSDFLAMMSHEIRTSLNGVIGLTRLLLDTALSADQRDYAETIRSSGEALLTIINDILDFSKIESGKFQIEIIDFDLRHTVMEAVELLRSRATSKGLDMSWVVHADVPDRVAGDPGRLRQILLNLLSNAIKFTHVGGVSLRVSLSPGSPINLSENLVQAVGGAPFVCVRFEVVDSGIGIPEEAMGRMFQDFSQADASTTRKYGGTGLGLAICKRLTELLGGQIGLRSKVGEGSTFWFTMALALRKPARKSAAPQSLAGVRVLLVDGDDVQRSALAKELVQAGLLLSEANGAAALSLLSAKDEAPPQAVILCVPEIAHPLIGLARRVREDPAFADLPFILIAGVAYRGDAQEVQGAGYDGFLTRPVTFAQLTACLLRIMAQGRTGALVTRHTLAEERSRGSSRLLLAEDNMVNQKVAVRTLERLGYRVDVVANGQEAVDAVLRIPYDAVLMDCQMPEMDGFEATRLIRARQSGERRVVIIAMTANAVSGDRERCLAAGMDDYIAKPFRREELDAVLARWLR